MLIIIQAIREFPFEREALKGGTIKIPDPKRVVITIPIPWNILNFLLCVFMERNVIILQSFCQVTRATDAK